LTKNLPLAPCSISSPFEYIIQARLYKLMAISMERRNYSTHKPVRRLASLNHIVRKNEIRRITKENEKFAKRLFFKKPFYSVKSIENDYSQHLKHKKRLVKLRGRGKHGHSFSRKQSPGFLPPIENSYRDNEEGSKANNSFTENPSSLIYKPKPEVSETKPEVNDTKPASSELGPISKPILFCKLF